MSSALAPSKDRLQLDISLMGHLTTDSLDAQLRPLSVVLRHASTKYRLLVDCSMMTSYDEAARERFVTWNREHCGSITRVAIVTDKALWHMVVSIMALLSKQQMKAFQSRSEAEKWLGEQRAGKL